MDLQKNLPLASEVGLIVTSPLRRTLATTRLGLDWLIKGGTPVQPRAEWQENSDMPCDQGSAIDMIAAEFPEFNFDTVSPEFPDKTGRWKFTEEAIRQRGIDCRKWLRSRPETVIAVVTHSAFLRIAISPTRFANADYRVFDFLENTDELKQWSLTEERGGGMGRSPKGVPVILPTDFGLSEVSDEATVPKAVSEAADELPT